MIAVGTTGPQQQAPDGSWYYRTSEASAIPQWALPDLNRQLPIATAGPQQQAPDRSGGQIALSTPGPQRAAPDRSGVCRT